MTDNTTEQTQGTERLLSEPELLTKVLPAGGPLEATYWTCPVCGAAFRGVPPESCQSVPTRSACLVEAVK